MSIGKKIQEWRMSKNLSQRKLAEKAGVSGQFISLVEKDESAPSIETLKNIADALDISTYELMELSPLEIYADNISFAESRKRRLAYKNDKLREKLINATGVEAENIRTEILKNDAALKSAEDEIDRIISTITKITVEFDEIDKGKRIVFEEIGKRFNILNTKGAIEALKRIDDLRFNKTYRHDFGFATGLPSDDSFDKHLRSIEEIEKQLNDDSKKPEE